MGDFYKPREPEEGKTIAITAELEEDDNRFTEDDYDITEYTISIPRANFILCSTDPCQYEIEDGEFRKNTFNPNRYVLDGTIEVVKETDEGTESEIWDLRADLDRSSTLEANDGTIRDKLFGGLEIRFPGTTLPVESFSISNASATFDGSGDGTLSIQGKGTK
jgi:hypothetical protein